jgi:hypothetical protein
MQIKDELKVRPNDGGRIKPKCAEKKSFPSTAHPTQIPRGLDLEQPRAVLEESSFKL